MMKKTRTLFSTLGVVVALVATMFIVIRDKMSEKTDERAKYCDERPSNTIH